MTNLRSSAKFSIHMTYPGDFEYSEMEQEDSP